MTSSFEAVTDLKPYPVYKDSGVPWLGKVPEHWELIRIGGLLRERGETNDDGRITDVLSLVAARGVIPYAEKGNIGNKKSDDITRYKIVRPEDIVVNCMNVIIGSVGISKYTGCLSPVYYVLTSRSQRDDSQYLNSCFQVAPFQKSLVRIGNGILAHRMRIPMELLKCEVFPRPPQSEQATVVRYLTHVDRLIRQYILTKRKLIKLLEEQKQAIIQQAVTRGLDPNVRLKPSGVEWLGDVPEHWEVRKIRAVSSRVTKGTTPTTLGRSFVEEGIRFIKVESISNNRRLVHSCCAFIDDETDSLLVRSRLYSGDVLVAIAGAIGRTAVVTIEDVPANCNQAVALISPDSKRLSADWLALVLSSVACQRHFEAISVQSAQANLSLADLRATPIPLPPRKEQDLIVEALTEKVDEIVNLIGSTEDSLVLLRELRTQLIADLVTGKFDVQSLAAELPEQLPEEPPGDLDVFDQADDIVDEAESKEAAE